MPVKDLESAAALSSDSEPVAVSPVNEWDLPVSVPAKPAHWDYGYVINRQTYSSTREALPKVLEERGSEIDFVWTPETPRPVFPEYIPFLLETFRRLEVKEARKAILVSAVLMVLGVLTTIGTGDQIGLLRNVLFVLGAVGLTEAIWRYKRSRNYSQDDAIRDASGSRFADWLKTKNPSGYTVTLCAAIVIVVIVQAFTGTEESVQKAGLVKPAVWEGQVWRLFTATLMHGSLWHFLMNFFGLVHLSKIIDQTLNRALVPLIFLVTGTIGSIFSLLLYPHTPSIGASGGLMGLFGFITVAAYFNRTKYPPRFFRLLIEGIAFIGVLGLFGFAFVDNAAHLGGLVGGLIFGWLFLQRDAQGIKTPKLLKFGGLAALCLLFLVTIRAIYQMIG